MWRSAKDILREICILLFPLLRLKTANKSIDHKIQLFENGQTPGFSYMLGYELLTSEEAGVYLVKTFDVRKSLEDKAKTNVFGVTISVSLIVGFSQLLTNINYNAGRVTTLIVSVLIVYSLLCLVLGTVLSLLILGKYNKIYDMYPENKADEPGVLLKNISINAELNCLYNIKRNNILYSSYGLIVNFLIAVSISFITVVLFVHNPITPNDIKRLDNRQSEMRGELTGYNARFNSLTRENATTSDDLKQLGIAVYQLENDIAGLLPERNHIKKSKKE